MKKTFLIFTALFITLIIFSSCNELKKMAKEVDNVERTVTPNPLVLKAGKVPINVSVKFPPKYFGKHVKLALTPQLKADGSADSIDFKSQTLIGEKFKDQGKVISYKNGGSFSFTDTVDYDEAYRMSHLKLKLQASTAKGKVGNVISVPLAKGIITTAELVDAGMAVDGGYEEGEKPIGQTVSIPITKPTVSKDVMEGKVYFALQTSNVRKNEDSKKEVDSLVSFIKAANENPDLVLKGIKIFSYASPDGPQDLNEGLVGKRGTTTESLIKKALKKAKVEKDANFYMKEVTSAEDWEGFKDAVSNSSMGDKDIILRVLSMYSDPDQRELEIKKIAKAYTELKNDILPLLRRSVIKLEFEGKPKTDDELKTIASSNPTSLKQEELIYAATVPTDLTEQEAIYKNYTASYDSDWKAWNNLAVTQVKQGKLDDAKVNFQKVLDIESDNATALNNLGVIYLAEGDYDTAWENFKKAENAGCNDPALGYNMGVILIKRGKYDEAVTSIKNDSFNKALAQTLSGDNNSAIATLNSLGSSDYAIFYYLKAVVAARDNSEDAIENLKIAVQKDQKLKDYAAKDMEFIKLVTKPAFKDIIN